jgi:hypothetical protein
MYNCEKKSRPMRYEKSQTMYLENCVLIPVKKVSFSSKISAWTFKISLN